MKEPKKVSVGDVEYLINPMSVLKANSVFVDLIKILGKPAANFLLELVKGQTEGKKLLDQEISKIRNENIEGMASALIELTNNLEAEKVEELLKILLHGDYVIPDGTKYINLESHFNNHGLMHLYMVVFEVLKVNFRDFLGVLGGVSV